MRKQGEGVEMLKSALRSAPAALLAVGLGSAATFSAAAAAGWDMGLPPGVTPVKTQMDSFHTLLTAVITAVVIFVTALLIYVMVRYNAKANPTPSRNTHNTLLEVLWTAVPVIILIVIAVPSFRLLYFLEVTPEAEMTIKATGRQWYWDYEYPDHGGFAFSAYMIPDNEIKPGQKRLLETDNRVILPVDTTIRVLVTAGDVIHSWAVPAFGVKKDAVPGRVNETWLRAEKEGVFYGQCSEICGVNHGFMPIAVEIVSKEKFAEWTKKAKTAFNAAAARDVAALPEK
jgi:cytochrome c oxidase subunit II